VSKWHAIAFFVGMVCGAALWHALFPARIVVTAPVDTSKIESRAKSEREKVNDASGSDLYDLARKRLQDK